MEEFLSSIRVSEHHIESYNHMVMNGLPAMIQGFQTCLESKEYKMEITFTNVHAGRASILEDGRTRPIYPQECRQKDLTYCASLYATVLQKRTSIITGEIQQTVLNKATITHLPVMVRSVLCNLSQDASARHEQECRRDPGGYFIINGNERVLVTQEGAAYNIPQVISEKDQIKASMRSMSEETGHSIVIQCSIAKTRPISESAYISLPYISKDIPIMVFFCALGYDDPNVIYNEIGIDRPELLQELCLAAQEADDMKQDDALLYIGQYASKIAKDPEVEAGDDDCEDEDDLSDIDEGDILQMMDEKSDTASLATDVDDRKLIYARQVIFKELFPHLGYCATPSMIFKTVCHMFKQVCLCRFGRIVPTERDNLMFKRFENSGLLLLNLFRICFKHFLGTLKQSYSGSSPGDLISKMCAFISKTFQSNFAKGAWGIQKNAYVRHGVSQILSRLSYIGMLSHLQRISTPIGKEGKNVKIRLIHPSQFGYICLFETPEGRTCGIVVNMTVAARFTNKYTTPFVRDLVLKHFSVATDRTSFQQVDVWINNTLKFFTLNGREFVQRFRSLRANSLIPYYINIYFDEAREEIHILSDGGRITRPVYDREGHITWIDPAEAQYSQIAMFPDEIKTSPFDYCEIHPCLLYSIAAGCIPFSDHMQSPRNVYESSMIKQSLGIFATSSAIRYDTSCEFMPSVQRTLCSTAIARAVGCHEMPAGNNCVVAIMNCGSWNAEDSLVFNEASIQRGLFHSITFKTITVEEFKKDINIIKTFCLPPVAIRKRMTNYDLLDENGIVKLRSHVKRRDVIVGRICTDKRGAKQDCSELSDEEGIVERVDVFKSSNGYKMVKIVLKIIKIPERGDKFANMCAQKGTAGMILPQVDMPFTQEGIVPDVIINPNALPSRMTISMFLEMVLGKHACMSGELVDATPFTENSTNVAEKIEGSLSEFGFDDYGWENLTNGETGEPFPARIFVGMSYYQKLKHMVSDKVHARPFGSVTTLTRQPPAGRSKDGGLRLGEMERDAVIAHGASSFLSTRVFDRSDAFYVPVCNICKVISNHKDECHLCRNSSLLWTRMPFASKLLFQQLSACLIGTKYSAELL